MNTCDAWLRYRRLRMSSWGPLRVFRGIPDPIEHFDSELANELKELTSGWAESGVVPGQLVPGQTYAVRDACEAALLLHLDHEICLLHDRPTLYRGQADRADWTIQASIDRNRTTGKEREFLADIYGEMLFRTMLRHIDWQADSWYPKGWHLDEGSAMAMSRHHGMPSPLIDLTLDPSVAVRFALQQARDVGADSAKVFRFAEDDLGSDAMFLIPPPPMLRSVRQYGVFFNCRFKDDVPLEPSPSTAIIVRFPSQKESVLTAEDFIRDDAPVDLMHDEPLLTDIEEYVRRVILPVDAIQDEYAEHPGQVPKSIRQLALAGLLNLSSTVLVDQQAARFRYAPNGHAVDEWFRLVTDMIHGLCAIHYDSENHRMIYRDDILSTFVKHNMVSSQILLMFFASACKGTPAWSLLPVFSTLNKHLLERSNRTAGIISPDFCVS